MSLPEVEINEFIQIKRLASMQAFFDVGIKRFSRITLDEMRRAMDLIEKENVSFLSVEPIVLAKRRAFLWGDYSDHLVIHLHSGGYVTGSELTSLQFCEAYFKETNQAILCPNYPLSPESTIDEIANWGVELLGELAQNGVKSFSLTGVSAGANLASLIALKAMDFEIKDLHLITGHFQSDFETESANTYQSGEESGLSKSMLLKLLDFAISDRDVHLQDPKIFPLFSDELEHLPATFIYAAKKDVLYDDSVMFYEKLIRSGVDVHFIEYKDGFHAWSNYLLENNKLLTYAKEKIFNAIFSC